MSELAAIDPAPLPPRSRSGSQKRQRNRNIGIPVDSDEFAVIEAKARASGLSIAAFGRAAMLGSPGLRARRSPPINAEALAHATAAVNKVGSNLNQIARVLNAGLAAGTQEIRAAAALAQAVLSAILELVGPRRSRMIAKGTTHDSGGRLAVYMASAKKGERAELWQLRGFASDDIKIAFRSVHVMAAATKCEQPLFHVQVRNPAGEHLTREQWEQVADRIESKLGLSGQPRAIAFHRKIATGDEHMHVGWSRIDDETLTAKTLSFYKLRLKEVSRELETKLGLTPVPNHRDGPVMSPTRDEDEQARRLGVDIREVRATIRECWEHSDDGRSFRAALSAERLTLAKGDQRDFIVIDHEGGIHALSKRILGSAAGEVRARMNDLDRQELPSVEQAREQLTRARANAKLEPPTPAKAKQPEPELDMPAVAEIRVAYQQARSAPEFTAALNPNGIRLAVVSAAEGQPSHGATREGEIVAVDQTGQVHELNQKTTGAAQTEIKEFLAQFDRGDLCSIEATQHQTHLEARRFIELTRVGTLSAADSTKERPEPTIDWKRMLMDADYRRELRDKRRLEQNNQQQKHEQGRSSERDRR